MVEITATMVKSLRDRTGAGMMDCKKALVDAGGDESKAVEEIQKKGLAKVAKRAGAVAAEGVVHAYIHPGSRLGVLVEVNCQTDFVARSPDYQAFVAMVGMQIASMGPLFVRREEVLPEQLAKQTEIFRGQLEEEEKTSGKKRPTEALSKIIEGKLNKWLAESCLLEQASIQDEEGKTINQLCESLSAKLGEKISIRRFVRYELGEGIEVQKKDFASEVAETMGVH